MKSNPETQITLDEDDAQRDDMMSGILTGDPENTGSVANGHAVEPPRYRRLNRTELVSPGDFVWDAQKGFELWEGPSGFMSDAFVMSIYRLANSVPPPPEIDE